MKFKKTLDELIIPNKGIYLGPSRNSDDEIKFAHLYDITNSTGDQLKREINDCIIGGPDFGKTIRFIVDNNEKRFIIFRPDCLHFKVAQKLEIEYPINTQVLYGCGVVKNLASSTKIEQVEYSSIDEMPRNRQTIKFLSDLMRVGDRPDKWDWADKYADITESLSKSILNDEFWRRQKESHYKKEL